MMCTAGCDHVTADQFMNWLGLASSGERIVYAVGFLSVAAHKADVEKDPGAPKLNAVQAAAWKAYERSRVHLFQRRLGPERYEYLAVKAK
jgi:hypothetical protein